MKTAQNPSTGHARAGLGRLVIRNTAVLSLGQIITLASMTLWTMLVARYIAPETYGIYSYAQATLGILVIFVNLGLDQLLTREVAQRPETSIRYLITFAALKTILSLIILGGFVGFILITGWSADRATITVIVTLMWFFTALNAVGIGVLQANQEMHFVVIAQSLNSLLTLVGGVVAVRANESFAVVLWLSLAATAIQTALLYYFAIRARSGAGSRAELVLPLSTVLALLKKSVQFAALALISVLYSNVVILLLRLLTADDRAVGYLAAAQRINTITLILPDMLLRSIFPAFSSAYARAPERFPAMFDRAYRYLFLVTVPMAVGLWVVSPDILSLIFGSQYVPAARTLQVLSLVLLTAVGYVMGPAMVAMDRQKTLSLIYGGALVSVAAAGYWAIPRYGAEGAAWALVVGNLVSFVVYNALLFRWLKLALPKIWILKTVIASALMGLIAQLLIGHVHFLIVSLVLAPAAYIAIHLIIRTLSPSDWREIRRMVPDSLRQRLARAGSRVGLERAFGD